MNNKKFQQSLGYIDEDLIVGAIEYTRTKKKHCWGKLGTIAACLCIAVLMVIIAPLFSENSFALKAYAMSSMEDGTISFKETDLLTQSDTWGGYYDGEFFYLNVGLGYEGENIRNVELVIENGFFATQSNTDNKQELSSPKIYVSADNRLIMNGTSFTVEGNTFVLDTPANENNLIFVAVPTKDVTSFPEEIIITATATFKDGSKQVLETSLDLSGTGVFIWTMDEEIIKEFEDLKNSSSNSESFHPVN